MRSPFLVAAAQAAQLQHFERESSDGDGDEGGLSSSVSSVSSSSRSGSTPRKGATFNNGNSGTSSSSTSTSAVASNSSTASSKKKKTKRTIPTSVHVAELDELPGSLLNDTPAFTPTPAGSGVSTPILTGTATTKSRGHGNTVKGSSSSSNDISTRSISSTSPKASSRAAKIAQREKKAKRWSNTIIAVSALPVAAVALYDYLYPASAYLSSEHTRVPTWRLSSIASRCLHLSYQLPTTSQSLLSTFKSASPLSAQNTQSSTSLISRAFSTNATTSRYLKGPDDICIVILWVFIFTLFRESLIRFVCAPLGRLGGVRKNSALTRFGEQGYDVVSHTLAVIIGFCIMQAQDSGYRNLDIDGLWLDYPHYKMPGNMKLYYLVQGAFWLQQLVTIKLEKRRKDYYQMFTHHIITVSLLYLSYIYNFTRIGNVILILMDVSDIFLGIAKMQKYLGYENLCNVTFGFFMISWIITRHILYPKVLSSVIWRSEELLYFDWNPEQEYFWSKNTKLCFVVLLSALQLLLILWFFMIVKIAVGVLRGAAAEDSRSDDEDEVESEGTTVDGDASSGYSTPRLVNGNSPHIKCEASTSTSSSHKLNGQVREAMNGQQLGNKVVVPASSKKKKRH